MYGVFSSYYPITKQPNTNPTILLILGKNGWQGKLLVHRICDKDLLGYGLSH